MRAIITNITDWVVRFCEVMKEIRQRNQCIRKKDQELFSRLWSARKKYMNLRESMSEFDEWNKQPAIMEAYKELRVATHEYHQFEAQHWFVLNHSPL